MANWAFFCHTASLILCSIFTSQHFFQLLSVFEGGQYIKFRVHLKGRDDFVPFLVNGDGVAGIPLSVDDSVSPLPADDDGLLAPSCTVQFLGLALPGHGGVWVAGDHGRN